MEKEIQLENLRQEERHKQRVAQALIYTQEYKDRLHRRSDLHFARDHWFVTIFDEYDLVNGTGYYPNISLDLIEESSPINEAYELVKMRRDYMQPNEQFTAFATGSEFSICYPADISLDGLIFSSVLHYVVYKKAEQFYDRGLMHLVLKTTDTRELIKLNYKVKYFEKTVWNMVLKSILYNGYKAMFEQHEPLMKQLVATEGTTLVFAESDDAKWGIGLNKDDARISDRKAWPGKNLLGELLTEIRVSFLGEY